MGTAGARQGPVPRPGVQGETLQVLRLRGAGMLSLGTVIAEAAGSAGRYVSWLPSYGPEQRGGSASVSVVMSGRPIGSPTVDRPDVLVCNEPARDGEVRPDGNRGRRPHLRGVAAGQADGRDDITVIAFPAMKIAADNGVPKAANTAFLGLHERPRDYRTAGGALMAALARASLPSRSWWRRTRKCSRRPKRG